MVKLSLIQFAPEISNKSGNLKKIEEFCKKSQGDIILLPELATTGYAYPNTESLLPLADKLTQNQEIVKYFQDLASFRDSLIVVGLPEVSEQEGKVSLFNSVLAVDKNGIVEVYRKLHLFGREKKIFTPGSQKPPVFSFRTYKLSLLICFDWVFQELFRLLSLQGVQVVLHSANLVLPWCQRSMIARALTNGLFIATANRIGREREGLDELTFTGGTQVVSPQGELLGALNDDESILEVEFDPAQADKKTIGTNNDRIKDRREDIYKLEWVVKSSHDWEDLKKMAVKAKSNAYTPYSNFPVGAAVMDDRGFIYGGCNVENSSYGLTMCAERSAIFSMVEDKGRKIKKMVIASNSGVYPCGACLQVIAEFADEAEILILNNNGDEKRCRLSDLMPHRFSKLDLT
ncbi:MAG: hypothetical protein APR63_07940 [Desulfuromonas sp. SDB]|nr:MAG: hypothetical protein APR63_07940 [Desulfuromonas sp. SDB]